METSTLPGWHCACGWFNKPAWVVCPGCERQRADVLAGNPGPARSSVAPAASASGPAHPFGQSAPRKSRGPLWLLGLVVGVVCYLGVRGVWQGVDRTLLHPERARADRQFQQFNNRTQPPASQTAAYAQLGRRVVAPDQSFRSAKDVGTGPMTPADFVRMADGAVTTADVTAAGLLRGWFAGWERPAKDRLVMTILFEYRDERAMPLRAEQELKSVAAFGAPTVAVTMPEGSAAFVTTKKRGSRYALTAVTYTGNRMATVRLMTSKRPGSAEFDWMRALVAKQKAALA